MAGTIPVALTQCVDINGQPMAGALLYIYAVSTVATPQDAFQDFGLSIKQPWPMETDQYEPLQVWAEAKVEKTRTRKTMSFFMVLPRGFRTDDGSPLSWGTPHTAWRTSLCWPRR